MRYAVLYFAHFLAFGVYNPYLPLYLSRQVGLSQSQIGSVLALFGAMGLAGPFLWGPITDRTSRRRMLLVAGFAMSGALYPLYLAVGGMAQVVPLAIAMGLVMTPLAPLLDDMLLRHIRATGGEYGRTRLWGSAAFIVGSMAAGWLLGRGFVRSQFAIFAAAEAAAIAVILAFPDREVNYRAAERKDLHFWRALSGPFVVFLVAAFLGRVASAGYYAFFSLYLESIGVGDSMKGVAWALGVVAEIGMMLVAGRILRRIGAYRLFLWGLVGSAVRYALYAVWPTATGAMVGQLLHSFAFGAFFIGGVTVVSEFSPPGRTATGQLAFSALCLGAGNTIGSLVSGYVADLWGYRAMYLASAALAVAASLVALAVARRVTAPAAAAAEVEAVRAT